MAYGPYCVLRANVPKPYLCELSNYLREPQIVPGAVAFIEERSLVQMNLIFMSQSIRYSFWYYFGACQQRRSRANSIWWWTWMFCFGCRVSALWPCHLSRKSTCDIVLYSRNINSLPVTRCCQPSLSAICKKGNIAFVYSFRFRITHPSAHTEPNESGMICSQRTDIIL
jgi:hypothetical protein